MSEEQGSLVRTAWHPDRGNPDGLRCERPVALSACAGHPGLLPVTRDWPSSPPFPARTNQCRFDPSTGLLHATPNWNLVNAALAVLGPCTELALCCRLLAFQGLCCGAAFYARHLLAGVYKD